MYGINDWRNDIWEADLTPAAKFIALALAQFYRPNKECYPSITMLMDITGHRSRNTIIGAIKELQEAGKIKVIQGKNPKLSKQGNFYEFIGLTGNQTGNVTGKLTSKVTSKLTSSKNEPEINEVREVNIYNNPVNNKLFTSPSFLPEKKKPTVEEVAGETMDLEELIAEKKLEEARAKVKKFKKPTVEEVADYCSERLNGVDAEAFVNFYDSKGWVVGKSPMKDWRAAVRTWERGRSRDAPPPTADTKVKHDLDWI